jgi:hypothetical protein
MKAMFSGAPAETKAEPVKPAVAKESERPLTAGKAKKGGAAKP